MDLITLEKEKLENKYKELCKEEYPGRLGKTFKTKYNFYYYDSGTGKVAQINKNVYKVLTKFLESENFLDFIKLDMSEQEFCEAISEIKDAINKESILSATKFNCLTGKTYEQIDEIKELYFDDFIKESSKYCKDCWAINLCTLCYVNCYDQYGTHFSYRHNSCRSERKYLLDSLIKYHEILEENPDVLKEFNEIEFQ